MGLRIYPYFPLCMLAAVAGTVVVLECCRYFKRIPYINDFITYCGQHTLVILGITNVIRKLVDWAKYCNGVSVFCQFILQLFVVMFYLTLVVTMKKYRKKGARI